MAVKYIPYFPDTLDGQALLNNFTRTRRMLSYHDNNKIIERVERGMPFYEMRPSEKVGDNEDGNMLVWGECLSACAWLKAHNVKVDSCFPRFSVLKIELS